MLSRTYDRVRAFVQQHVLVTSLALIAFCSVIFAGRNWSFIQSPNFYAEDATVLYQNIYHFNPVRVVLTLFNGYLIVGQYLLAYVAAGLNFLLGNDLEKLPLVTAAVSCVFLGFVASLPYLLFRKWLGARMALIVVVLTALVPLKSYDYAIIGTISNLKFVFLYIAFLFVVYRYMARKELTRTKVIVIDAVLLLCALTNATVAFMLPFALLPYVTKWFSAVRRARFPRLEFVEYSGIFLVGVSLLYVGAAVLKGIPKIPGYLDGPFNKHAILPILDRSTSYSLLYPITNAFNDYFVAALMFVMISVAAYMVWKRNQTSYVVAAAIWAVFLGTVLFVINRPGVGDYYLGYGHKGGPDQFFFAQNMIFIFAVAWVCKGWVAKLRLAQLAFVALVGMLYLLLALPFGTSFGGSATVYRGMQDIDANLQKACVQYASDEEVVIQIYPTPYWQWRIDRDLACHK